MSFAWSPVFRGVDQIETRHPARARWPHLICPHRCPHAVGSTLHSRDSAKRSAASTSFFGCFARTAQGIFLCWYLSTPRKTSSVLSCSKRFESGPLSSTHARSFCGERILTNWALQQPRRVKPPSMLAVPPWLSGLFTRAIPSPEVTLCAGRDLRRRFDPRHRPRRFRRSNPGATALADYLGTAISSRRGRVPLSFGGGCRFPRSPFV